MVEKESTEAFRSAMAGVDEMGEFLLGEEWIVRVGEMLKEGAMIFAPCMQQSCWGKEDEEGVPDCPAYVMHNSFNEVLRMALDHATTHYGFDPDLAILSAIVESLPL